MNKPTLRQKVIKTIVSDIQTGTLAPNALITESDICDSLNVSRTPVREALIELVKDGILVRKPRYGYVVLESDEQKKLDSYALIGVLDGFSAFLATPYLTEEDYFKMNEYIDMIDVAIKYRNYKNYYNEQENFHEVYLQKCPNKMLVELLNDLKLKVSRYTYFSEDDVALFEVCKEVNEQHRQILEMLKLKEAHKVRIFLETVHWHTFHYDMI
ncbi:MAG: GntR family transcriptional regulator [Vagococcus sp.]|nr:GntR family transcriptional regulator [Vagococcus sp.]